MEAVARPELYPADPVSADGFVLAPGDRVTFGGRTVDRFVTGRVLAVDGPLVLLQLGEHPPRRRQLLIPAAWLEVKL